MASWSLPPSSSPLSSSGGPSTPPPRRQLLHPFAASSKAWQPPTFNSKRERSPSNSPSSSPQHKRARREESIDPFDVRHLPASSSPFGSPLQYAPAVPRSPYRESIYEKEVNTWSAAISDIFQHDHETRLDLSGKSLTFISSEIESLGGLVRLSSLRAPSSPPISRAISLPTNSPGPSGAFQRVSTTAIAITNHAKPGMTPVQIFLSGNQIRSLPAELFRIENLTVLSLRNNNLMFIPPAIGALKNLQELGIGGNMVKYLPAEIEKLPLQKLNLHPNRWLSCPGDGAENTLSPLQTQFVVPTLSELCIRILLSFPAGSKNTLLEQTETIHGFSGIVPDHYLKYFTLTCRKPTVAPPPLLPLDRTPPSSPIRRPQRHEENDPNYDLRFSVCPNREHGIGVRKTFIKPAEIRYRWVKKIGSAETGGLVPLEYRGCEIGCLNFLEDAYTGDTEGSEPDDDDVVF